MSDHRASDAAQATFLKPLDVGELERAARELRWSPPRQQRGTDRTDQQALGSTRMDRSELDRMSVEELVDLFDDLSERRTPMGWTPDDASLLATVQRRILSLVRQAPAEDERRAHIRVPCDLQVDLRSESASTRGRASDIGLGGVFVETSSELAEGTAVELEVRGTGTNEHGLRVRGTIAWRRTADDAGLGVSFGEPPSEAEERRLRRFVLELLRNRDDG